MHILYMSSIFWACPSRCQAAQLGRLGKHSGRSLPGALTLSAPRRTARVAGALQAAHAAPRAGVHQLYTVRVSDAKGAAQQQTAVEPPKLGG